MSGDAHVWAEQRALITFTFWGQLSGLSLTIHLSHDLDSAALCLKMWLGEMGLQLSAVDTAVSLQAASDGKAGSS